jgi:hypothetical protein
MRTLAFISVLLLAAASSAASLTAREAAALIGRDAHSRTGEKLGVVENVLLDRASQPRAVIVKASVFMGLWDCRMAIEPARVTFSGERGPVVIDMTRSEFNKLPEWEAKQTPELKPLR